MTCSRALATAAILATMMGCTASESGDSDDDTTNPPDKPVIVDTDAPPSPAINCSYPASGSPGVAVGNTVPSFHKWQGVAPGEQAAREISVAELFDCAGGLTINGQPVNAVMIDTSKFF